MPGINKKKVNALRAKGLSDVEIAVKLRASWRVISAITRIEPRQDTTERNDNDGGRDRPETTGADNSASTAKPVNKKGGIQRELLTSAQRAAFLNEIAAGARSCDIAERYGLRNKQAKNIAWKYKRTLKSAQKSVEPERAQKPRDDADRFVPDKNVDPACDAEHMRLLWCQVLNVALDDAKDNSIAPDAYRQEARRFLTYGGRDFRLVCTLAGLDPIAVLEKMRARFRAEVAG